MFHLFMTLRIILYLRELTIAAGSLLALYPWCDVPFELEKRWFEEGVCV